MVSQAKKPEPVSGKKVARSEYHPSVNYISSNEKRIFGAPKVLPKKEKVEYDKSQTERRTSAFDKVVSRKHYSALQTSVAEIFAHSQPSKEIFDKKVTAKPGKVDTKIIQKAIMDNVNKPQSFHRRRYIISH